MRSDLSEIRGGMGQRHILVGAHRGAMGYAPENTLAAFETAIEMGTYRIELDVRRCRSGELIVIHDATVDRTTDGAGAVADIDLGEIKRLRAVRGTGGGTGAEVIPTLQEALFCARARCRLLVEIKETGLADDVVAEITGAGMEEDSTVSSFLEDELIRVRESSGGRIATAYFLTEPGQGFDPAEVIARLGINLLVVWPRAAMPEYVAAAKEHGLHVRCGFRDDMSYAETFAQFRRMAEVGVDEMASGRPDWMRRMADEHTAAGG